MREKIFWDLTKLATFEGWVLARKLSDLLWKYYEPSSAWKPGIVYSVKEILK
jgi:hypothetical protein